MTCDDIVDVTTSWMLAFEQGEIDNIPVKKGEQFSLEDLCFEVFQIHYSLDFSLNCITSISLENKVISISNLYQ